jgi:hypothetical protein
VADYGSDFLNVVGKKASEAVAAQVGSLTNEIAGLKAQLQNVGKTVTVNARDKMKATITAACPDWEQINVNPEFHEWLSLPDPFSGAIRHELLKQAYGRNEAARVLAFFTGFLNQEAAGNPQDPRPDTSHQSGKIPLETFAAPGRAKTAADTNPGSPAEKPIITRSEITDFYAQSAAGKWRGREKEYAAREAQINAAVREGRVR